MSYSGRWCPAHRNGYDDCSFLHRPVAPPSGFRLVSMPPNEDDLNDFDHGPDCLCPNPACREWIETNAGRGFAEDGTPL